MPYVLYATVQDVTLRAKEFQTLGSAEISLALADAVRQINVNQFGTPTLAESTVVLAQAYLAAHFLSARNPLLALPAGPVSEDKVDGVEASYAVAAPPASEADFNTSRWGRAFLTLCRQNLDGRVIVT
jgi:Protein of unknown function (DUF4054)